VREARPRTRSLGRGTGKRPVAFPPAAPDLGTGRRSRPRAARAEACLDLNHCGSSSEERAAAGSGG